jgi:hypothetical protein
MYERKNLAYNLICGAQKYFLIITRGEMPHQSGMEF